MPESKIHIKNMVCPRCIMVVEQELTKLNITFKNVELGEVNLSETLSEPLLAELRKSLQKIGFDLVDNKKSQIIEKVKVLMIDLIQNKENDININYSNYLSEKLEIDYNVLSSLFSAIENTTIEKYIINLKIEKVKEWLVYHDLTLNEIAYKLNYSSVSALSNQFKKVTGLTPSYFKALKLNKQLTAN